MRIALLLVLCLGCAGERGRGPAWPKLTDKEVDGGEDLAPHTATTVTVEQSPEPGESTRPDEDVKRAASKPAPSGDAPASAPSMSSSTPDDPITTEDIVIEIDD